MEFLRSLTACAAFLSLATLFLPEKEEIRRAAACLFSLLFLLTLIPKAELSFSDIFSPPASNESAESRLPDALSSTAKDEILKDICRRFSIPQTDLYLESDLCVTNGTVSMTYLTLYGKGQAFFADFSAITQYVKAAYAVDCEVHFVED